MCTRCRKFVEYFLSGPLSLNSNLQRGDMFGQVALTTDGNHDFNVRAAVYSEVLSLPREAYEDLSAESEKFMELVETEAIKQEQFIVKAQKNLQRLAKMKRMGATTNTGGGGIGGLSGTTREQVNSEGKGFANKATVRKSMRKTKTLSSVVSMFTNTGSSKVVPKEETSETLNSQENM